MLGSVTWLPSRQTFRSSRPWVFCKKGGFINFAKFTGKQLCGSLFLLKKETLAQIFSCEFWKISKGGLIRWNFSFTTLNFLFRKKSVEIFQEAKCGSWNIIQFVHTIKFHSYDHDNVPFIPRTDNFYFKSCLKILKKRSQLCC